MQKGIIDYKYVEETKTGSYIVATIASTLNYFGICDKIMSCTLDNASNNLRAVDFLKPRIYPIDKNAFHIKCATHTYNLIVKDGVGNFGNSCEKARISYNWIFKSKIKTRITKFKNHCKEDQLEYRKVPREVSTRWNSLFEMFEIAYIYQNPIQKVFDAHNSDLTLCSKDWEETKDLVEFLRIFYIATNVISGQYYPTISSILVNICVISSEFAKYKRKDKFIQSIQSMIEKF